MKKNNKDEVIQEGTFNNALNPVSVEGMETILTQMKYSVCKITLNDGSRGTGFLSLINYLSKKIPFLITNEHVIKKNDLQNNNEIILSLNNNSIIQKIKLDKKLEKERIIFIDEELDITLIEIKPNIDGLNINNCIELDDNISRNDDYFDTIKNKSIYLLNYPGREKNIVVSYGLLSYISNNKIYHRCNTEHGSSGSPILSLDTNKVIGIHRGICKGNDDKIYNIGILFKYIIYKLNNKNKTTNVNNTIKKEIFLKSVSYEINKKEEKGTINIAKLKINLINTNKEKIYNNGDRYVGIMKNDKKEGKGTIYYNNGNIYEGYFKNDLREGKGIYHWNNGQWKGNRYEGDFKNDKKDGKGKYFYNNGNIYEGDFKNDKCEGKGIYYFNNGQWKGDKYEGDFLNDKKDGKGVYYYKNGDRYEGDFKNNLRDGKGTFYYKNGDKEMGDYLNDNPIGIHTIIYNNGKQSSKSYL